MPAPTTKAAFIEPMLLLPANKLPEGTEWMYELKLDGYRAIAFKSEGRAVAKQQLPKKYLVVAGALGGLPDQALVDCEVVALDESDGHLSTLRNYASATTPIVYYVFDVLVLTDRAVMTEPLWQRHGLLRGVVLGQTLRSSLWCLSRSTGL